MQQNLSPAWAWELNVSTCSSMLQNNGLGCHNGFTNLFKLTAPPYTADFFYSIQILNVYECEDWNMWCDQAKWVGSRKY